MLQEYNLPRFHVQTVRKKSKTKTLKLVLLYTNLESWFEWLDHVCTLQKLFNPTFDILLHTRCCVIFIKFRVKYNL